jgi:peptidyl-prolyl cis-trans isomerase C
LKTPPVLLAALLAVAAVVLSCGDREATGARAHAGKAKVLATVNGKPITEKDLDQRARRSPGGAPGHDPSGNVLQTVVREELIAQRAVQLGLHEEPGFREKLEQLEAQVRAFERQELAALYRVYVRNQAVPTEAEARAWFEQNAAFVRTRFHVLQILRKGEQAEIARDREDVKGGTPFEQVAARRFQALPEGPRPPWDLGEMSWHQVPRPWRGIVDRLEPGQVSEVIQGEGGRSWVIKLAGRRTEPAVSFDTERERIVEDLRQQKAIELYEALLAELKAKAQIVYAR